jgi:hypothetical protein
MVTLPLLAMSITARFLAIIVPSNMSKADSSNLG